MRILLLLLCFVFGVCSARAETTMTFNSKFGLKNGPKYVGSGTKLAETRKTEPIHSVEVGGGVSLRVVEGPPSVQVNWDDNLVSFVQTKVVNGVLAVEVKVPNDTGSLTSKLSMEVVVSTPAPLRRAELSGGASVNIERSTEKTVKLNLSGGASVTAAKLSVTQLDLDLSGGATATLAGTAEQAKFEISGGATCNAEALKTQKSRFDVSGGATAKTAVAQAATGEVSGGASLNIAGTPKVMQVETSGAGTVNGRSSKTARHGKEDDDDNE